MFNIFRVRDFPHFLIFFSMTIFALEVHHENPDIIGRMESVMSTALGYSVTVADILCYPKNKLEDDMRKHIELCLFIQAKSRIKARRILSYNKKLL